MSYAVFWKRATETTWHKLTSPNPITWNESQVEDYPIPFVGPWFYEYTGTLLNGSGQFVPHTWSSTLNNPNGTYPSAGDLGYVFMNTLRGTQYFRVFLWGQATNQGGWVRPVTITRAHPLSTPTIKCKTTFSTGFSVTETQCVTVRDAKPECGCCGELVPIANRILRALQ